MNENEVETDISAMILQRCFIKREHVGDKFRFLSDDSTFFFFFYFKEFHQHSSKLLQYNSDCRIDRRDNFIYLKERNVSRW